MSLTRKDEHINLAQKQKNKSNYFDNILLESDDLPNLSIDDIDLSSTFLGYDIPYPFYINGMTGGSQKALEINDFLSKIANHYHIPMMSGSQSIMFKDPSSIKSFEIIRKNHKGIVISNINPNMTLEMAMQSIEAMQSNALAIHLNVIQELVMKEGDRDFRKWEDNIKYIHSNLNIPVIIKQVGAGFSNKSINKLVNIGIKHIDVSGSGGTSFIDIESSRGNSDYNFLKGFEIDTANILLNLKKYEGVNFYASGGIRNPMDVIKSLVLGANACGLSKWFLDLTQLTFEEALKKVDQFITDLKKIMIILGVSKVSELSRVPYTLI